MRINPRTPIPLSSYQHEYCVPHRCDVSNSSLNNATSNHILSCSKCVSYLVINNMHNVIDNALQSFFSHLTKKGSHNDNHWKVFTASKEYKGLQFHYWKWINCNSRCYRQNSASIARQLCEAKRSCGGEQLSRDICIMSINSKDKTLLQKAIADSASSSFIIDAKDEAKDQKNMIAKFQQTAAKILAKNQSIYIVITNLSAYSK